MFFYVGEHTHLLPKVSNRLYLDDGWSNITYAKSTIYYKGYTNKGNLLDLIPYILHGEKPPGIWVVIDSSTNTVYYPTLRSFPLYSSTEHDCEITNLKLENHTLVEPNILKLPIPETHISPSIAAQQVVDILTENISNYLKYYCDHKPLMINTGGAGTVLIWAILDKLTQDYLLHSPNPDLSFTHYLGNLPESTVFYNRQTEYTSDLVDHARSNHWGYHVLSVFSKPNTQICGYYGDNVLMYNQDNLYILGLSDCFVVHGIVNHTDYMYSALRNYNQLSHPPKNDSVMYTSLENMYQSMDKWISQDHQMWHIDNNIVFNPYFDIRIHEVMRQIEPLTLIELGINVALVRMMIELVNPIFNNFVANTANDPYVFVNFERNKHLLPGIENKLVKYPIDNK